MVSEETPASRSNSFLPASPSPYLPTSMTTYARETSQTIYAKMMDQIANPVLEEPETTCWQKFYSLWKRAWRHFPLGSIKTSLNSRRHTKRFSNWQSKFIGVLIIIAISSYAY